MPHLCILIYASLEECSFGVRVTLHTFKTYQMGVVGSVFGNARYSYCEAFLLVGLRLSRLGAMGST